MSTEQKYTSANTSINSKKLPYVYSRVTFPKGSKVTDYGCGRFIDHIREKVESMGCEYIPYDPYNLPGSSFPKRNDIVVCSNVLNVIDSLQVVKDIITEMCENAQTVYITVYEGDGTGKGKPTGIDSYQRNEKTKKYLDTIISMGYKASCKNRIITVEGRVA